MDILKQVDGNALRGFLIGGATILALHKKEVNDLNVFPVPDGDTGTNMGFTMDGAVREIAGEEVNISEVAKKMAKGALLGARGNSGVILSQYLKGISVGLAGLKTANAVQLADAFCTGVDYAYKAVLEPTEGTILTVMREASEYAKKKAYDGQSISDLLSNYIEEAHRSLDRTPELLPVLKKAGVVDSGAAGLIRVIEGFRKVCLGEEIERIREVSATISTNVSSFGPDSVLEYGYCTEFILQLMNAKTNVDAFDINVVTNFLSSVGDSVVAVQDEDKVKIHVHTKTPARVIEFCQAFGEFVTFKMENMSVQHNELNAKSMEEVAITEEPKEKKAFGVVSVATGEGLIGLFKQFGADEVVNGGQTMNPSSEDFIKAFEKVNAENIIVMPNNSNIYLSAKQASELYKKANIYVMDTSTIAEGYSALAMLDTSSGDVETILSELRGAYERVDTLSVTYAVRDGNIDGITFEKGDFICLSGKKMLSANKDKLQALRSGLLAFGASNREMITLIFGSDLSKAERGEAEQSIRQALPNLEIYTIDGEQDIYSFVVAIE